MLLKSVETARETATPNVLELVVTADLGGGDETLPYTYSPNDAVGLSPLIAAWLDEHPELVIEPYEPPAAHGPEHFPLTARQLRLGLIRNGYSLASVQAAIDNISNPAQRDEAQVYWEFSTVVHWDHQTTQALLALSGIDPSDAAAMWMAAKDYEA